MDLSHARHRQTVHELVRATYDNYTDLFSSVISPSRFEKAEAIIRDPNELWLLEGAAVSYILRPNLVYNAKLKDRMEELFPHDFDAGKALGIPIRCKNLPLTSFIFVLEFTSVMLKFTLSLPSRT